MKRISILGKNGRMLALAAGLAASAALSAGEGADAALAPVLDKEITIDTATQSTQVPAGGKFSFKLDAKDQSVKLCTRDTPEQKGAWSQDLASGCNVTLTFTKGERYCTLEDVKAGDGEVLASCHRLRAKDVATAAVKGGSEMGDLLVFILPPAKDANAVAILIDSPSRVTQSPPIIVGKN
jgi:hypothetical protein